MHEHRGDRRDKQAAVGCGIVALCLSLAVGCGPEVIQKSNADTKRDKAAAGRGAQAAKTKKASDDADAGPDVSTGSPSRNTASGGSGGAGGTGKSAQTPVAGRSAAPSTAAQAGAGGAPDKAATEALTWSAPALLENATPDAHLPVFARNRAGDVVVSWWQDDADGYIWMRRFINGAWDNNSFRVKGATNPGTFNWTQFVGIDRLGAAEIMYLGGTSSSMGKPSRVYWVKWQGEDSVPLETKPLVLGDQVFGLPINLGVSDTGLSNAHWLSVPDDMTKTQVMYTNTRSESGWATPTERETIPAQGDARMFSTATNTDGDYITAIRYKTSDPDTTLRSVHTYLQRDGVLTVAPPIETSAPALLVDMELDTGGNATVAMLVGTDALMMNLYTTRYSASSKTWTTPEQLSKGFTKIEDLTLLPGAVPFVAWIDAKEMNETTAVGKIVTSRFDAATGKWAAPEPITDEIKMLNGGLWTAANSAGSIVVAWAGADSSDASAIYYARYTRADGWSKPGIITPYTGEISIFGLVLAEDGRALVTWQVAEPGTRIHDLKWSRSR